VEGAPPPTDLPAIRWPCLQQHPGSDAGGHLREQTGRTVAFALAAFRRACRRTRPQRPGERPDAAAGCGRTQAVLKATTAGVKEASERQLGRRAIAA
jgi:hypothetical protein